MFDVLSSLEQLILAQFQKVMPVPELFVGEVFLLLHKAFVDLAQHLVLYQQPSFQFALVAEGQWILHLVYELVQQPHLREALWICRVKSDHQIHFGCVHIRNSEHRYQLALVERVLAHLGLPHVSVRQLHAEILAGLSSEDQSVDGYNHLLLEPHIAGIPTLDVLPHENLFSAQKQVIDWFDIHFHNKYNKFAGIQSRLE